MNTHRHRPRNTLRYAADQLDRVPAALGDHPDRQTVQDIADYLAGRRLDPGSPFALPTDGTAAALWQWRRGPIRYGRRVWALGEDGELGYLAEGHDRRALAAINARGRDDDGPRWAAADPDTAEWFTAAWPAAYRRWVLIHDTCGCTPAQHAEHLRADTDGEGCPCRFTGLPPCEPDRFAWQAETVPADTPGAIAVTGVER